MVLSNVLFTEKNEDRTWPKDTLFLHQVGGKPLRFTLHPASLTHKQWADRDQPTPQSLWGVFTLLEWISHLWSKFLTAVGYPRLSSLLQHFSKHFPGSKVILASLSQDLLPSDSTNTGRSACSHLIQECCGTNYLLCNWQCRMLKNIALLGLVFFHILFPWRALTERKTEHS